MSSGVVPSGAITQSTLVPSAPSTVMHRSVVGPGGSTPQRSVIGGSPQAAVAWLFVDRRAAPESSSGSARRTSAHTGALAVGPGSTVAVGAHPAAAITTVTAPATAKQAGRRRTLPQ